MSNKIGVLTNNSVNEAGSCTACGKKSECKCDRCGDFYCTEECQRKDWPSHRFICFPMPKLVKVGQNAVVHNKIVNEDHPKHDANSDISAKIEINLPHGSCVAVFSFKSTNRCFIGSTNPSAIAERERICKEINDFGKKSSGLSDKPKTNSYVLALKDGKWCRAQILKGTENNKYRIFLLDFGNVDHKPFKELRKTVDSIINLPRFIQMVSLRGITNFTTRQTIIKSLEKYANKEYRIQYVTPDETGANVELFQWGTNISLNSIIQELSSNNTNNDLDHQSVASSSSIVEIPKTQLPEKKENHNKSNVSSNAISNGNKNSKPSKEVVKQPTVKTVSLVSKHENKKAPFLPRQIHIQQPCLNPPFKFISINENDHGSNILVLDNSYIESGYLGCLLEKYYNNLKDVIKFLEEHDVGDQPYKPKVDEYCLAKFDDAWYRAKVLDLLSEDRFLVVYIDFTNEKELSSDSIRRYPLSLNIPCCTTLCGIDGLPDELSDELKKFLNENLTSFTAFTVDSIRMENNVCYLKSLEILNKLRDLKLL